MRTIIAATNYSHSADNAINYAAALARHTNSKLVLFNSFELSVAASNTLLPASAVDESFAINRTRLKEIALNISREFGIQVTSLTRTAFLEEELDYQVKRLGADLVVIGMSIFSYKYGFEHLAASLIRHAKFPVLAVPEDASFKGISKILFAFDPTCIHAANQLPLLAEIAAYFNAQVQICHIEKNEMATVTHHHAGNIDLKVETLFDGIDHLYKDVIEDDIIKGIVSGIEDSNADLLVMVPHKYGFWESMWHKSKTGKMTRRTHIPLLALPNPTT